jgi:hypothetical protein
MKQLCLSCLLLTLVALSGEAQSDAASEWPAVTARLEQAVMAEDINAIRAVRDECIQLLGSGVAADRMPLIRYAAAYATWRMVYHPSTPEKDRDRLLDEAAAQLELALKANDRFAEAHGLLASVLGMKINSMWRGMTLGPRVGNTMGRATSLEPENPRIVMQEGIGAIHTPSMFGGGTGKAEQLLRRSLLLFDKEPANKPWPNWGRFDAHAWLGQVLVMHRDFAGAKAEYDKALQINPKSGWVRYFLIPEMEKAAKKK